jgi:hypothetical protein
MADSESTLVTGSPLSRGPRRGDVLGERYEMVELLDSDALAMTYRALDQESETHVLFRLAAPGALGEKEARSLVRRLSPLVGIGGRTIQRIRDVDREGSMVFIVEPWPEGTTLRAVLDSRAAKGTTFSTLELLPVLAKLAEVTLAVPEPWFHGDLRAHRIYVRPDGVRVTGGFALAVLPGDTIVDALTEDVGVRRQFAPEVGDGLAGRPSDRWSVAALAWEALTGAAPGPGPKSAPAALGELGKLLLRYLDPDPALRPTTLEPLVVALAKHGKTAVPKLEPEPFAIETDAPSDERTQQIDHADLMPSDTTEVPLTASQDRPGVNDTMRLPAVVLEDQPTKREERDLSDIDPNLLRAAAVNRAMTDSGTFKLDAKELKQLGHDAKTAVDAKKKSPSGDLDPRLVRAALGLSLDDAKTIPDEPPPKASRAVRPRNVTQELDASDLEDEALAGIAPRKKVGAAAPAANKATPSPARVSGPPMPAPRPIPGPTSSPAPAPVVKSAPSSAAPIKSPLPPRPAPAPRPMAAAPRPQPVPQPAPMVMQAPMPQPMPQPTPQPRAIEHARVVTAPPASASSMSFEEAPTRIDRKEPRVEAPRSRGPSGSVVIAVAVVFAVVILALAFWYRSSQQEAALQRQIDDRVREIHQSQ